MAGGETTPLCGLPTGSRKAKSPAPSMTASVESLRKGGGWQLVFHRNAYQWYPWPEKVEGPPPTPFWPDRTLYDILQETLDEQIIDRTRMS